MDSGSIKQKCIDKWLENEYICIVRWTKDWTFDVIDQSNTKEWLSDRISQNISMYTFTVMANPNHKTLITK